MEAESDIKIKARFDVNKEGGLEIHATVENHSPLDAYLFNGLWTLDAKSQFAADEEQVYRYLTEEDKLIALIGIQPLPRSMTPLYQNVPHLTPLPAGHSLKFDLSLPAVVKEYNPYFPETPDSTYQKIKVQKVELQVQYLLKQGNVQVQESKVLPKFLELITPAALEHVKTATSPEFDIALDVQKRTDEFERD